jgi:ribonuclease J
MMDAFLLCSSTNLYTLASFHAAAKSNNIPMIANSYICKQCQLFSEQFGQRFSIYNFNKIYRWQHDTKTRPANGLTQAEYMRKYGFLMIVSPKQPYLTYMEKFRDLSPILIYSLWDGFLDENHAAFQPNLAACVKSWPDCHRPHTGGHASTMAIATLIHAVQPRQAILTIHTEMAALFHTLPIDEFHDKIKLLHDGEEYLLG